MKTKKVNLNKTPVYIPNQPKAKGGEHRNWMEDSEYEKEREKEERIHMKQSKIKGK